MHDEPTTSADHAGDAGLVPPPPPPPPSMRPSRRRVIGSRTAAAAVAGGLVVGGIAGGYVISQAATSSPSASASPAAGAPHQHGFAGGGAAAHSQDLQQVATAIGITTAQLQTEMSAGKTIAAIAKEHNVAAATVISALVADENAEIDAAVSSGHLTQAQAAQMKTQTTQRVTDFVNGTMRAHGPGGPGGPGGGLGGEDGTVVAGTIGISTSQLQTELSSGKTIAAIAKEHNVAAAAVISALVASENKEIDQRVSSGAITAAQAAQIKAETTQRVTDEVNGTHPAGRPDGAWGGGPMGGGHDGSGPPPTS
jgi:hypothetical protein